ncbi:MAG: TIGR00730 family Rossman fold protein [Chlamydiales bacterium]|nr:TIGR00730 family Rossman fold protein [Chlamydiales bacterium]
MDAHTIAEEILRAEKTLGEAGPYVAIFGSGDLKPDHQYYQQAYNLALQLSQSGCSIVTGGGGGIMEAANRGAQEGNGSSVGLCLKLQNYEKQNPFIDEGRALEFTSFFSRKATFLKHIKSVIVFPGGLGTLDEVFEVLIAMRAQQIPTLPCYFIGREFWKGLMKWMKDNVFDGDLAPKELLNHLILTDCVEEIPPLINQSISCSK